ncbi:MAG: hypothetical protein IJQ02_11725 [Oscillospiraceae bacterium]|nr:hypothetical protein [Oscillospiraceae bacterium]
MSQRDRDSLQILLDQTFEIYQGVSRLVQWSAADSEYLDTLMESKEWQKDIDRRIVRATGSRMQAGMIPLFLSLKAWQRTKAVYSFERVFVEDMARTEDTSLYISLLDHLPYRDMLFFFPEEVLPMLEEEIAGLYVHLERQPGQMWMLCNSMNRNRKVPSRVLPGTEIAFLITDGMKISQVFETPEFLAWKAAFKKQILHDHPMSEQLANDLIPAEQKALSTVVHLMYYLASKNADIKPVKPHKKKKKIPSTGKTEASPAVRLYDVGTEYAEIVYRRFRDNTDSSEDTVNTEEDSTDPDDAENKEDQPRKPGKKRRPHVRRAHWQHYWTGKGRTTLEVRWKSDLFVGANRDEQATVVYEIAKESLKGKRNPNTSKKKREK